ncbi:hypothetical protein ACJBU6_02207 [Exserohilum turcicum]
MRATRSHGFSTSVSAVCLTRCLFALLQRVCSLAVLESTGCHPLDTACFCATPTMAPGIESCLSWFCPVLAYYEGSSLYHTTCNTGIRNSSAPLVSTVTAVATIAFVAVTLRFLTRIPPLSIKWGADDWLVLAMVPIAAFFLASILKAVDLGFGQDIYMLTPRDVAEMTKYYHFEELGYVLLTFLTKMTVLTFYLRIFPIGKIRQVVYAFIAMCTCLLISIFLAHFLQCVPISFIWEQWEGTLVPKPKHVVCGVNRDNLNFVFGITNVIMDGSIMVLPIPRVLKLDLRWQKKIAVLFVFCIGFLITGIAIARISILLNGSYTNNTSWNLVPVVKWSAIEIFLSIAITCFPQMHVLAKALLGTCIKFDTATNNRPGKLSYGVSSSMHTGVSHSKKQPEVLYENLELGFK